MKTALAVIFSLIVLAGCSDKTTPNDTTAQTEKTTETSTFGNASEHQEEISHYDNIYVYRHVSQSYRDMMMSGMQGASDRQAFLGAFDCATLSYTQPLPAIKTPDSVKKVFANADASRGCDEVTYLPAFTDHGDVSFTIVTKN